MKHMLANRFGHFESSGRSFTITDPRTPMPWVNVICNGRMGLVVSQNGGGFTWCDNSQLNVLTRWEMDLVRDNHGKFLFIADLDSKHVWSASPAPTFAPLDEYLCTHTLGSTAFRTQCQGIRTQWTLTVSPTDTVEIWQVKITNASDKVRRLRVASFFEWCCGVAPDTKREFHRLFFTTRYDAKRRAIVTHKNMWDAPHRNDMSREEREKRHWNHPWPYVAAHAVHGPFDAPLAIADKGTFTGRYQPHVRPEAMLADKIPSVDAPNNFGRYGDASGALGGDLTIQPGKSVELTYTIAIADDENAVLALVDRHTNPAAATSALQGVEEMWTGLTSPSAVKSAMSDFDLLNSAWLPYQAISARLWARTGYYQQSGAFGFRDQLQDSQVWLARKPEQTRAQILLHAAHQFTDGSVYHWWHPLAEMGNHTACSDDYLWLAFITANYIKDTGDWGLLDEMIPFVDSSTPATLLDHCKRSIAKSLSRQSPRGLPLIGSCDWNDGLSSMGIDGKGESIWLAQWLCVVLEDFAHVLEHSAKGHNGQGAGDLTTAKHYRDARQKLASAINTHAWDADGSASGGGQWYRAATRDDGRWIGTKANAEGQIFLNTQTWAILSQTAPKEREDACWKSVRDHLLHPMGPVLSYPAYTEPDTTIGYITRYAPGLRENGGVYMHAATWALAAACKRRDTDAVEKIWRAISPPLRGQNADAYVAEPYVMPGNVDGPISTTPGKAGWTWYTGSAAWLNRVSLEWVLGLRAIWEGLLIDPVPFASLGKVEATRLWRGKRIRLRFDADQFKASVAPTITANGVRLNGQIVRVEDLDGQSEVTIDVTWGSSGVGACGSGGVHVRTPAESGAGVPAGSKG